MDKERAHIHGRPLADRDVLEPGWRVIPPEGGKLREREEGNERVLEVYDQVCALDPDLEAEATAAIPFLITIGWPDEARLRA
ncbi:hypothetical protein [Microbispora hainanensis]|uniref:Uncharacterized protein n=1 Tax=Microbispora hainanensis TaxID=568844 RepID=A0ABZ1SJE2_9ACTN|nr:hypothetical protein [Microbispora hainanensis]